MGFTKDHAKKVLEDVFKAGNIISLTRNTDPDNEVYTKIRPFEEDMYTIKEDDFVAEDRIIANVQHLLYALAEETWGTADGFVVMTPSGTVLYIAKLTEEVSIEKDTVPVFKKAKTKDGKFTGSGIRVSLDAVTASASSE